MGKLDEEILLFVKRNGPSTPIDIAQKMGVNSIIITAVLVDAMSQNKILRSKRKIGSSKYYFYPEHLSTLQRKIADGLNLKEKELLQKLLKEMVEAGCQYAVIETSSEGIKQYRHKNINYDAIYDAFGGWLAYAMLGNTYNLRRKITKRIEELFNHDISSAEVNRLLKVCNQYYYKQ